MTKSKVIIDSVTKSEGSTRRRTRYGYVWLDSKGKVHRIDGPAVDQVDGVKEWYKHGTLHRLDGPAIEWADGPVEYYVDGRQFTEDEFNCYIDHATGEVFVPPGKKLRHD